MQTVSNIPITVICGFLGSGKTTYLNRLITGGTFPEYSLILVNDFGSINVDAQLIEFRDDRIIKLSNGCICCTLGGTLADQLAEVVRLPDPVAAIYIEASGISDPQKIVDITRVSSRFSLDDVVCLVDGSQQPSNSSDARISDIWHAQIYTATKIILNRSNTASDLLSRQLREINPTAEIIVDKSSATAASELHSLAQDVISSPTEKEPASGGFISFSITFQAPVDRIWLEGLLKRHRNALIRAKGIVYLNQRSDAQVLQFSGNSISFIPSMHKPVKGQLVCIGIKDQVFDQLVQELKSKS